ncbi:MAG: GIY-YIG nuclease family protein [Candidatus Moranbacteria bacterium]|jgi:putative endonuclease|nr:GIY-YIG nuclease family protein [Candidatus Moranbacteria bacterium]MDD5652301.1 GIY-YIG nuclease family protein [Candidatus Moranbacteria bacterium]MDX9855832.1 GIY-YIG nuclease family protein [Candidatus Moranbacteria bacterium]
MYTTYVLENLSGKSYTGSTNNLRERLEMHNDLSSEKSKFHRTTYKKGPWEVVFRKDFDTRRKALEFEKYLKTGKGREWLKRTRRGE